MSDERVARFHRKPANADSMYVEQASEELFSGPGPDTIPSSYSSLHHHADRRRFSSRSRSSRRESIRHESHQSVDIPTDDDLSLSMNSFVGTPSANHYSRPRSESRSSFRFFSWDEVEQAEGISSVAADIDPVEYEAIFRAGEEEGDAEEERRRGKRGEQDIEGNDESKRAVSYLRRSDSLENTTHTNLDRRSRSIDRRSSIFDSVSAHDPLLLTRESEVDDEGGDGGVYASDRFQQRFYISEEDMVIVFASYKSSRLRQILYFLLCISTLGIAYLILRWFPRLRIACIGKPAPLGQCDWVVIENQWGELSIAATNIVKYYRPVSTVFKLDEEEEKSSYEQESSQQDPNSSGFDEEDSEEYIDRDPTIPFLRWIEYRHMKFFYHPLKDMLMTNHDWVDIDWINSQKVQEGLDSTVHKERELVFGPNIIDIKEKSTSQLLIDEALHPFYVFQVFSIILWAFDEYYYYASCIFIISIFSVGSTLIETKRTFERLRNLARFECEVRVLRNGFWTTSSSADLVPGDVYELSDPNIVVLPCDSLLLAGDCIVNESMLTGESVPVSKTAVTEEGLAVFVGNEVIDTELSRHLLYSGTRVIRVRRPKRILPNNEETEELDVALAMVTKTGFSTTKGALIRSMLFPKPTGFKFYEDSFKYIGVMASIAVVGFIICTINFIRMNIATHLIVLRALDLVTIVVPPALPATLTIGTNISLERLRGKSIFCISPSRINIGGKLDVLCFDKTGTLTEDGLDVLGVHFVKGGTFTSLWSSINSDQDHDVAVKSAMVSTLTTCHSLRLVNGELIGDPLDAKMFEFTGWQFQEADGNHGSHMLRKSMSPNGDITLTTLKVFEFVSSLRRMSVVTMSNSESLKHKYHVYLKGAPEVMESVCDVTSFPRDYHDILAHYTHRGYRVIACAYKELDIDDNKNIFSLKRDKVESNLRFIGFLIFENKLKPTTKNTINQLSSAKIRTIMCTGDNVLTAISVGRECGIIDMAANTMVFAPHFDEEEKLTWESVDDRNVVLDNFTMRPRSCQFAGDYTLAVTGDAFRYIIQLGSDVQLEQMLIKGGIYARMSPDEKHELVEKLQSIDYTVGFCGDGANDCGALKAADVGVSLSEAEASVAAPFTSRIFDISCVIDVIKEGRSALTTSFSCFKYMSLYSVIQFISVSILYSLGSSLGDFQFLWIDLFLIIPIAVFMAWAEPYPVLSIKRPTANLVSRKVLIPMMGQIIILGLVQFGSWHLVRTMAWYTPPIRGGEDNELKSSDNMALFIVSCFQYIFVAVVLSVGPPFRQPMYKNKPFLIIIGVTTFVSVSLLFVDPNSAIGHLMDLSYTGLNFKLDVILISAVSAIVSWVSEKYFFHWLARFIGQVKRIVGFQKTRKRYKILRDKLTLDV